MLGGPNGQGGKINARFSPPLVRSLCPIQQPRIWPWWFIRSWLQLLDYCCLCSPFFNLFLECSYIPWKKNKGLPVEHDPVEDLHGLCLACLRGCLVGSACPWLLLPTAGRARKGWSEVTELLRAAGQTVYSSSFPAECSLAALFQVSAVS